MQAKRRLSERGMSAFGRGTVRTVLLSGLSAVAIACAASFAFADPLASLSCRLRRRRASATLPTQPIARRVHRRTRPEVRRLDLRLVCRAEVRPRAGIAPSKRPLRSYGIVIARTPSCPGDAAIQSGRFGPSSLDRFASARDDGGRSTERRRRRGQPRRITRRRRLRPHRRAFALADAKRAPGGVVATRRA